MAKQREIELEPPLGGLNEGLAFEQQAPFTAPVLMNMRGIDPDNEKARMAQRPGTTKAFSTQVGGEYPVTGMAAITTTYIKPST